MLEPSPESLREALGCPFKDTPHPELEKMYKRLYIGLSLHLASETDWVGRMLKLVGLGAERKGQEIRHGITSQSEVESLWQRLDPHPEREESYYWRTVLIGLYTKVHLRPDLFIAFKPLRQLIQPVDPLLYSYLAALGLMSTKPDHLILTNFIYHESILGRPVSANEMERLRESRKV